ncbi:MAG: GNAT family N-acetyltransferase [Cyanobacteriota bacterium]|nr:GNAT family N-acetyltransferase [Cyanobacteriota bacterium]
MVGDTNSIIVHLDGLTMEALQLFDLDSLAAIWSDPEVTRFLPSRGVPIPKEKVEKALASFVEHWKERGYGIWKIVEDETNKMVGYSGLRYLEELKEVELLYCLAKTSWGSGNCGLGVSPFGYLLRRRFANTTPFNRAPLATTRGTRATQWLGNLGTGVDSPSRANFQDKGLRQKQLKHLCYSVLIKPI